MPTKSADAAVWMIVRKLVLCAAYSVVSVVTASAQTSGARAIDIADQARTLAREGKTSEALDLYRLALRLAPESMTIRRDYAVTLGWAEDYPASIEEFRKVREQEPDQPAWALREMARSELFGDQPGAALATLNQLIDRSDRSEATLMRKALALRWLGRSDEAQEVYREMQERYPEAGSGWLGVVYALSDQGRLGEALRTTDRALAQDPDNWQALKARGQVLNWMGFHLEAQKAFDAIPPEYASDREVLEGRAFAARWGGRPNTAQQIIASLARDFPANRSVAELQHELDLEYGYAATPSVRMIDHNDGLADRTYAQDFTLHANPTHRFDFGYQYRRFSQEGDRVLAWRRYSVNWQGTLGRRTAAYVGVSSVDYLEGGGGLRFFPEAGISHFLSNRVWVSASTGQLPMDAFRAVGNRVAANHYSANVQLRPTHKLTVEAQYARFNFSNQVHRDRVDLTAFRRLLTRGRLRMDVGLRSNFLWHDRETTDFFSPTSFQTHLVSTRFSGWLSDRLQYSAEVGFGLQREPGVGLQSPLAVSGLMIWRLRPALHFTAEAGRSTSSVERVNPGRPSYSRRFVSVSLKVRVPSLVSR